MIKNIRDINENDGQLLVWALQETGHYFINDNEKINITVKISEKDEFNPVVNFMLEIYDIETQQFIDRNLLSIEFWDKRWISLFIYPRNKKIPESIVIDWLFHIGVIERLNFPDVQTINIQ